MPSRLRTLNSPSTQDPQGQVLDLATCAFISRHENVCLVGQAGVGKSYIAQAIGYRACVTGHHVIYVLAHQMVTPPRASRADATYDRKLLRFTAGELGDQCMRSLTGNATPALADVKGNGQVSEITRRRAK